MQVSYGTKACAKGCAVCCTQHAQRRLFVRASIGSHEEAYKCAASMVSIGSFLSAAILFAWRTRILPRKT